MSWLDPATWTDWEADFFCGPCGKDEPHFFIKRGAWVTAHCVTCDNEHELDPDDLG